METKEKKRASLSSSAYTVEAYTVEATIPPILYIYTYLYDKILIYPVAESLLYERRALLYERHDVNSVEHVQYS